MAAPRYHRIAGEFDHTLDRVFRSRITLPGIGTSGNLSSTAQKVIVSIIKGSVANRTKCKKTVVDASDSIIAPY